MKKIKISVLALTVLLAVSAAVTTEARPNADEYGVLRMKGGNYVVTQSPVINPICDPGDVCTVSSDTAPVQDPDGDYILPGTAVTAKPGEFKP